jgi:hypothetical protein
MKGFQRPAFIVLPENSIVPDESLIAPPPNQFTHELIRPEPFYFTGPQQGRPPDGELSEGAQVVLMVYDGGAYCRVVDQQGLYVVVAYVSLRKI